VYCAAKMSQEEEERICDRDAIYREAQEAKPLDITVIYGEDKGNPKYRVHILVPNFLSETEVRSEMERISHNYGKAEYFSDLIKMFGEMSQPIDAILHLVRMNDYKEVIENMPKGEVILNLCDGSDADGVPGPCVSRYLEEKGIPHCGCNYLFTEGTTHKYAMKERFIKAGVSTAKFTVVSPDHPLTRESVAHMTYPLFVKAADSYGSIGLSKNSVVKTYEECVAQVKRMQEIFQNILVEEFILGAEFSVLIIGDCRFPDSVEVFPPAQRVFNSSIPYEDRFLSYKLVWEEGGVAYSYEMAEDKDTLMDLAKRAYDSVSGNGFGRIDIRRRDVTKEYFVLEVNATCGVGYDSSSDLILKLGGKTCQYLLEKVLCIDVNFPSKGKPPTHQ